MSHISVDKKGPYVQEYRETAADEGSQTFQFSAKNLHSASRVCRVLRSLQQTERWESFYPLSLLIENWQSTLRWRQRKVWKCRKNDWILTELIVASCDQTSDFRAESRHVHSSFCVDTLLPAGDLGSSGVRHRLFVTFHSCNAPKPPCEMFVSPTQQLRQWARARKCGTTALLL